MSETETDRTRAPPVEATNEELRAANRDLQALNQDLEAVNRRLEEELRRHAQLVELSCAPMLVSDFSGLIVAWHGGSEELYGYGRGEAVGRNKHDLLATRVTGSSLEEIHAALLSDGRWSGEVRQKTKDGRELTVESRMRLGTFDDRSLVLESARDITAQQAADGHVQVLLGEVTHRVRNTIAVIQAISRHTGRNSRSMEDFTERFEGRLSALASAHTLLVGSDWKGADLGELARALLAPYVSGNAGRLCLEGETVTLPADLATPFSLALHELATNAARGGALSVPSGRVRLRWTVSAPDPERRTRSRVAGSGRSRSRSHSDQTGSPATALIDSVIPGAHVERRYSREGFVCTIELPLLKARQPQAGG